MWKEPFSKFYLLVQLVLLLVQSKLREIVRFFLWDKMSTMITRDINWTRQKWKFILRLWYFHRFIIRYGRKIYQLVNEGQKCWKGLRKERPDEGKNNNTARQWVGNNLIWKEMMTLCVTFIGCSDPTVVDFGLAQPAGGQRGQPEGGGIVDAARWRPAGRSGTSAAVDFLSDSGRGWMEQALLPDTLDCLELFCVLLWARPSGTGW